MANKRMPRLYETAPGPGGSGARSVRPPPPPPPARWRAAGGTSPNNGPKWTFRHSIIRLLLSGSYELDYSVIVKYTYIKYVRGVLVCMAFRFMDIRP